MPQSPSSPAAYIDVRSGIFKLPNATRQVGARNVNPLMTESYWEIGRSIVEAEQKGKRRAAYGEQLIERLSADLTQQFGREISARNLDHRCQFYLIFEQFRRHHLRNLKGNVCGRRISGRIIKVQNMASLPFTCR